MYTIDGVRIEEVFAPVADGGVVWGRTFTVHGLSSGESIWVALDETASGHITGAGDLQAQTIGDRRAARAVGTGAPLEIRIIMGK
jgi:hypothetical protein